MDSLIMKKQNFFAAYKEFQILFDETTLPTVNRF